MKNYKFLYVIMVLALCFGAAQSVDAKKKKTRKRVNKTEKKQRGTTYEILVVDDSEVVDLDPPKSIDCVEDKVLMSAAYMPEFPGGDRALMNFIAANLSYPIAAQDNKIEGKVVVQFVVTKSGKVGEVKVARSVHPVLDNEAVRVCRLLPDFIPGRNSDGDPVNVWYTLPINFKL